jgi:ketosteroid isomerase-like protein
LWITPRKIGTNTCPNWRELCVPVSTEVLGCETNQPADLMFDEGQEKTYSGSDEYVMGLENANRNAHEVARNMLNSTQKKMKRDYDVKILEKQYEKGDLVYVLDTASIKGKCRKLSTPWKGPGVVLDRLTPYIYKIKLQRVIFTANHDRLKACRDRKIPVWLQKCQAQLNRGECVIQSKDVKERKKYCICRGPDTEKTMIGCDYCKDWFHLTCVDLSPQ